VWCKDAGALRLKSWHAVEGSWRAWQQKAAACNAVVPCGRWQVPVVSSTGAVWKAAGWVEAGRKVAGRGSWAGGRWQLDVGLSEGDVGA
jgi:hypothetical protein